VLHATLLAMNFAMYKNLTAPRSFNRGVANSDFGLRTSAFFRISLLPLSAPNCAYLRLITDKKNTKQVILPNDALSKKQILCMILSAMILSCFAARRSFSAPAIVDLRFPLRNPALACHKDSAQSSPQSPAKDVSRRIGSDSAGTYNWRGQIMFVSV